MTYPSTVDTPTVVSAGVALLRRYAVHGNAPGGAGGPDDAGPAVLAALVAGTGDPAGRVEAERALAVWLRGFRAGPAGTGVYQGHAGFLAGLDAALEFQPVLSALRDRAAGTLAARLADRPWPPPVLNWADYDLISGPAGAVLVLAGDDGRAADLVPAGARLLADACADADLRGLRLDAASRRRQPAEWETGRVNAGIAHGVTGVAAALRAAAAVLPDPRYPESLDRVCRWLARQSYVDPWGVRTWPPGGSDGPPPRAASRRQAWCYGTPGVAWTLWDAGRQLADDGLRTLALDAMTSFCAAFDEERYLYDAGPREYDSLAFCHGAAGTLAVADAFARHAGHTPAAALRERLTGYLLERLDTVDALAGHSVQLLNGASGVLAVLLTTAGGDRRWLAQYGLR